VPPLAERQPSGGFFLLQLAETFFWRGKMAFSAMQSNQMSQWVDPFCAIRVRNTANRGAKFQWVIAGAGFILSLQLAAAVAYAQRPATDNSAAAFAAVDQHFASLPDYHPGDLITRSQVAEALAKVADAGTKVPNAERILAATLPDNSFLAKELSTPAGRKFMRKVARHPGGFDRLDRLSSISRGQTLVRDLIRSADGDKLIEYLTTTRGGRSLGSTLAGARQGANLNQPTGRIYTADDLMAAIEESFAVDAGRSR
jgi:hypothetical protein